MRRADRLFQIVQKLRGGRLVTARQLADRLEVSERTIYRDIADLQSTGVPIDGEAGVGYILREGFDLPPLMFTRDEVVALVAGARLITAWGGASMARAAEEAIIKIGAVLPKEDRPRITNTHVHSTSYNISDNDRALIDLAENAAEQCRVLSIVYTDLDGNESSRDIRPLGLWFWGKVWTLISWCELRNDFRTFRIDRIAKVEKADRIFRQERGKTLADFYRRVELSETPDNKAARAS
ncbi:DNA-binding transcriptional regulator [Phyllobacterium brassicacearum]|uniref:DNA-binding transcriptional regulator n=1 Tax=Phyllobacterium brassicacearum TaxID=314235 RepID=A0A2P7BRF8_9HYPH|nr:YafY family protein [Phyllobacterium brassicacearum]PSH69002.1 DNA-binding transcriptional regulator [Phyllobacterium brassicacearum]TDQ25242.1 putative DNA-binding transcriptional regulator YafY [Phyllobacterium brassicacearum]